MTVPAGDGSGRFAYDGLERVIHEKARLGILTSLLARPEGVVFVDLKSLCSLTDGNLNRHLKVLEEDGLVEIWKSQRSQRPQTLYRLTTDGRKRFLQYISELERVVKDTLDAAEKAPKKATGKSMLHGWSPA